MIVIIGKYNFNLWEFLIYEYTPTKLFKHIWFLYLV